jgi:hypothetical protein
MQLLQAGSHQVVLLELDPDLIRQGAEESGFTCVVEDHPRSVVLELSALDRDNPLLLFDASASTNTGWFSRCQFYIDGRTGSVMQTPFLLANRRDAAGKPHTRAVSLQIRKELPAHFRLPGRQAVNEKMLYSVLFNFLAALQQVGVGICGKGVVAPLTGRGDAVLAK